ncbi:uncharacterized protein N7511_002225 [Penicillium nucicola]|uniref:uncharacterized protein n=1 Tax=Penicillium nucicola TaxID=1850975 RepID=UPI0025454C12|nr:uncharacterized protein N7511_002225 [Penicillium nucicola]KAJ5770174.1 hypothetical protein N7511_002225 [Penicillium nucicola]
MTWVHNLHESDPDTKIGRVIAICVVFPVLALLAICLRFYVRLSTKRPAWWDDYTILASVLLTVVYGGLTIAQTRWGLGLSQAYFPEENVIPFSKIQYVGGPIYTLDLLTFKVALLASYLRIGGFVNFYRLIIAIAIAICVATQLIFTFVISASCRPVAKQWDLSLKGTCIDTVSFYYVAIAGTNLGFDIAIIILPLPVLWKLQLQRRQKLVLTAVFTLGFFVTIIQIIRIFSVKNLKTVTDSQGLICWSIVEVSLGAIITCIPTYGPLFKSFASTITFYRKNGTGPTYPLDSIPEVGNDTIRPRQNSGNGRTLITPTLSTVVPVRAKKRGALSSVTDTGSEEHILGDGENMQIYKTMSFKVEKT